MRVKIDRGTEFETATPDEVRELLHGLVPERPIDVRVPISQKADANGNALIEVYTVPLGRVVTVTRVVVEADGFNPASPYQNAGGYLQVRRQGGQTTDFVSLAAPGGLPAISTDSDSAGGRYVNGEVIEVNIVGGAPLANVNLHVYLQGREEPADTPDRGGSRAAARGSRR